MQRIILARKSSHRFLAITFIGLLGLAGFAASFYSVELGITADQFIGDIVAWPASLGSAGPTPSEGSLSAASSTSS